MDIDDLTANTIVNPGKTSGYRFSEGADFAEYRLLSQLGRATRRSLVTKQQ